MEPRGPDGGTGGARAWAETGTVGAAAGAEGGAMLEEEEGGAR